MILVTGTTPSPRTLTMPRRRPSTNVCRRKHVPKSKPKSKVHKVMREFKEGKLHSGSKTGPKVKNPKQAVAIALSEQRRAKS